MSTPKVVTELIGRSNRLGSEARFTNYAGGNTSAKDRKSTRLNSSH